MMTKAKTTIEVHHCVGLHRLSGQELSGEISQVFVSPFLSNDDMMLDSLNSSQIFLKPHFERLALL
jgi:hypothetical protein